MEHRLNLRRMLTLKRACHKVISPAFWSTKGTSRRPSRCSTEPTMACWRGGNFPVLPGSYHLTKAYPVTNLDLRHVRNIFVSTEISCGIASLEWFGQRSPYLSGWVKTTRRRWHAWTIWHLDVNGSVVIRGSWLVQKSPMGLEGEQMQQTIYGFCRVLWGSCAIHLWVVGLLTIVMWAHLRAKIWFRTPQICLGETAHYHLRIGAPATFSWVSCGFLRRRERYVITHTHTYIYIDR